MCTAFIGSACSADQSNSRSGKTASTIQSDFGRDFIAQSLLDVRQAYLATSWTDDSPDPNAFIQTHAPFEFWMFLAVLNDEQGQRYAMQQRLSRLRIKQAGEVAQSAWDFSDVMAVDYRLEPVSQIGSTPVHTLQLAQRAALSLAGASAEENKLWLGPIDVQQTHFEDCRAALDLKTPQLRLRFNQTRCLDVQASKTFSIARGEAMPINGEYMRDGQVVNVTGLGWLVHAWGVPPENTVAAVVFDRAWLWLENDRRDNTLDVQVQRSRRRSGSGPVLSTGTMSRLQNPGSADFPTDGKAELTGTHKLNNPQLQADAQQVSADGIPLEWRFAETSQQIDVRLVPVVVQSALGQKMNLELTQEIGTNMMGGGDWFGAVAVEGTHSGAGFVSFTVNKK